MAGPKSRLAKYILDESFTRIGDKPGGTFEGGIYRDKDGVEWVIKEAPSDEHAKNEVLASKLYGEAGVRVPEVDLITMPDGSLGIMSRKESISRLDPDNPPPGTNEGFAADAWLGNRDVAGATFDNIYESGGSALRIDTGGAMRFRAQGEPKLDQWGPDPVEAQSLRNRPGSNTSRLFKGVTDEIAHEGGERVRAIPEERIKQLVDQYGPDDQAERRSLLNDLMDRRSSLPAIGAAIAAGSVGLGGFAPPAEASIPYDELPEETKRYRRESEAKDFLGRLADLPYDSIQATEHPNLMNVTEPIAEAFRNLPGPLGFIAPLGGVAEAANNFAQTGRLGWGDVGNIALDALDLAPARAAGRLVRETVEEIPHDLPTMDVEELGVEEIDLDVPRLMQEDAKSNVVEVGFGKDKLYRKTDEKGLRNAVNQIIQDVDSGVIDKNEAIQKFGAQWDLANKLGGEKATSILDSMENELHDVASLPDHEKGYWTPTDPNAPRMEVDSPFGFGTLKKMTPEEAAASSDPRIREMAPFLGKTVGELKAMGGIKFPPPPPSLASSQTPEQVAEYKSRLMPPEYDTEELFPEVITDEDYGVTPEERSRLMEGPEQDVPPLMEVEELAFPKIQQGQGMEQPSQLQQANAGDIGFDPNEDWDQEAIKSLDAAFNANSSPDPSATPGKLEPAPEPVNPMLAGAAQQLKTTPEDLTAKVVPPGLPSQVVHAESELDKLTAAVGGVPGTNDLQQYTVKMWNKFKQDNPGVATPHPYDLEDKLGPGLYHMNPNQLINLFEDFKGGNPSQFTVTPWKEAANNEWSTAYDAGNAVEDKVLVPNWYQFPKGRKQDYGPPAGDEASIEALRQEAVNKGLSLDTESRLQRASEGGFRSSTVSRPDQKVFHVRGGTRPNLTQFNSQRGPMGVYLADSPYAVMKSALQTPEEFRRSYPVMFQGKIFGDDPLPDWYLPQNVNLPAQTPAEIAIGSGPSNSVFDEHVLPNIPQELRDRLEANNQIPVLREFWKETAWPQYEREGDDLMGPRSWRYGGPATKTAGGFDETAGKYVEERFSSPILPPDYAVWEDYNYDPNVPHDQRIFKNQELLRELGYTGTRVSDEAGFSIGISGEHLRSPFATFDPDTFAGGKNPTKNIMAGLGLTAVSLPAIMAQLTGDDEDGFWAQQLQDRMNPNGYY